MYRYRDAAVNRIQRALESLFDEMIKYFAELSDSAQKNIFALNGPASAEITAVGTEPLDGWQFQRKTDRYATNSQVTGDVRPAVAY